MRVLNYAFVHGNVQFHIGTIRSELKYAEVLQSVTFVILILSAS